MESIKITVVMENPIKDNRVVRDITFAIRLLGFAFETTCNDACSEDEKTSMISYSSALLEYQLQTVTDEDEIKYLKTVKAKRRLKKAKKWLSI